MTSECGFHLEYSVDCRLSYCLEDALNCPGECCLGCTLKHPMDGKVLCKAHYGMNERLDDQVDCVDVHKDGDHHHLHHCLSVVGPSNFQQLNVKAAMAAAHHRAYIQVFIASFLVSFSLPFLVPWLLV